MEQHRFKIRNFLLLKHLKYFFSIPCNSESNAVIGKKYRSDSNWLFIELRGNAYALRQHKGPLIKYSIVNEHGPDGNFKKVA